MTQWKRLDTARQSTRRKYAWPAEDGTPRPIDARLSAYLLWSGEDDLLKEKLHICRAIVDDAIAAYESQPGRWRADGRLQETLALDAFHELSLYEIRMFATPNGYLPHGAPANEVADLVLQACTNTPVYARPFDYVSVHEAARLCDALSMPARA